MFFFHLVVAWNFTFDGHNDPDCVFRLHCSLFLSFACLCAAVWVCCINSGFFGFGFSANERNVIWRPTAFKLLTILIRYCFAVSRVANWPYGTNERPLRTRMPCWKPSATSTWSVRCFYLCKTSMAHRIVCVAWVSDSFNVSPCLCDDAANPIRMRRCIQLQLSGSPTRCVVERLVYFVSIRRFWRFVSVQSVWCAECLHMLPSQIETFNKNLSRQPKSNE